MQCVQTLPSSTEETQYQIDVAACRERKKVYHRHQACQLHRSLQASNADCCAENIEEEKNDGNNGVNGRLASQPAYKGGIHGIEDISQYKHSQMGTKNLD